MRRQPSMCWLIAPSSRSTISWSEPSSRTFAAARATASGLLEPLLYAPRRKQACRDALWRLKQLLEGGEAGDA